MPELLAAFVISHLAGEGDQIPANPISVRVQPHRWG
jgi:hypothetical protein